MTPEKKQQAVDILRRRFEQQRLDVFKIEERLADYFDDLTQQPDLHNAYELLCAVKFLRLLRTYEFNAKKVRQVIRLREGEWQQDRNGIWRHVKGGIACPGTTGPTVYRWEPFQVFVLASVFGFQAWIDTQLTTADRQQLLPTERLIGDRIEDLRRLCTDFTFYAPRKTDKTGLSAFIQVVFFLLEDANSECYCVANSASQSSILYRRAKLMLSQLDDGHRFRMTETVCDWRQQFKMVRDSSIRPLSAGGRTKDGLFAQLCCADEYGSAAYTNEKSDMKMLVDVVTSSMGPRREPLLFITTTAGRIQQGPFIEKLESLHNVLMRELEWDTDTSTCNISYDRILCVCFEPDEWEAGDEETLLTSKTVRAKVNPMLGRIVQHQFYDDAIAKARLDGDLGEVISKLFNVYQVATIREWIKPEEIRALQIDRRIDECDYAKGWLTFAGCDFSKGGDLNGVAFLCYNTETGEFFGDMDVYISEQAVSDSPIQELWRKWAEGGWIKIVPGKTFDPSWPVSRMVELDEKGINFCGIGYDPFNAKIVINALSQWIYDMGLDPKQIIKPVRQNFATYNPAVAEFDYMVKRSKTDVDGKQVPEPLIHLSRNPLWPYCFSCCVLQESTDGMENVKPVKRQPGSQACKVDPCQMLLSALLLYDQAEQTVT